ncbi:MAG: preprotein translocase subunit SecY [Sphingobacteriia bacterium]|nr:preprotein translocase subunit SecY [Sphingobacteriia bacterium]
MMTSLYKNKGLSLPSLSNAQVLQKKLLYIIGAFIVYRIGCYIPLPGIDARVLDEIFKQNSQGILGIFNMLSGGSLGRMTIFALAMMPYITASIIMQLMTIVSKDLETLKKEGEVGRKKINQYTRYLTIILCAVQSFGIAAGLEAMSGPSGNLVINPGIMFKVTTITSLTAGTIFLMWLGERITQQGLGNGTSLLIFAGIVAGIPNAIMSTLELGRTGALSTLLILVVITLALGLLFTIVFVEKSFRKLLVQYPKRQVGNKVFGGESTHMPIKINMSGVIPPIFASSILLFPLTIVSFSANATEGTGILDNIALYLAHGKPLYMIMYTILIVFFCFFYTSVVFNPEETAENLKKNGGFFPGKRPGKATVEFLDYTISRLTVVGAIYLVVICLIPEFLVSQFGIPFYLGGTSILIVVNVVIESMTQIQTHLYMNQYQSLLKKMNLKGNKKI